MVLILLLIREPESDKLSTSYFFVKEDGKLSPGTHLREQGQKT